jgi:hypothetical protein
MNLTHAPEIVSICIERANKLIELEKRINVEYKRLQKKGRSFFETEYSEFKDKILTAYISFKTCYATVMDLYPEYASFVPNLTKPIFRR